MTMFTTRRSRILPGVVLGSLGVLASASAAPPAAIVTAPATAMPAATAKAPAIAAASKRTLVLKQWKPNVSATSEFYEAYVVPRMSLLSRDENAATTADLRDPSSNRSTQDQAVTERVGKRAIRAFEGGLKTLAIERLGIERWSFPVFGGRGQENAAVAKHPRGARVNLGFSNLAPRADLLIPVSAGRVVVSGDVRGRFTTTFESVSSRCHLAATVDVPERQATIGFSLAF